MIKDKYLQQINKKISRFNQGKNLKFFIFGSSLAKGHFGDIDLGVVGNIENMELSELRDEFADSTLPYSVDIVEFNKVSKEFKDNVFDNKILWMTP